MASDNLGVDLVVEGVSGEGQTGAVFVRWPDGDSRVLTLMPHRSDAHGTDAAVVTRVLAGRGTPVPAIDHVIAAPIGHIWVQRRLPGRPVRFVCLRVLDQALWLNEQHAGALVDHHDVGLVPLYLTGSGNGFCHHQTLRGHSRRSARIESWVRAVGRAFPEPLAGEDAVHFDFHPGNMLADGSDIVGVVDWGGAGRGDCRFDIVTFRFSLMAISAAGEVIERLDALLDQFPDDILLRCWAHMSLRMTDWSIRHFSDEETERWMDIAEQRIT
jgi:hypothetical protein